MNCIPPTRTALLTPVHCCSKKVRQSTSQALHQQSIGNRPKAKHLCTPLRLSNRPWTQELFSTSQRFFPRYALLQAWRARKAGIGRRRSPIINMFFASAEAVVQSARERRVPLVHVVQKACNLTMRVRDCCKEVIRIEEDQLVQPSTREKASELAKCSHWIEQQQCCSESLLSLPHWVPAECMRPLGCPSQVRKVGFIR